VDPNARFLIVPEVPERGAKTPVPPVATVKAPPKLTPDADTVADRALMVTSSARTTVLPIMISSANEKSRLLSAILASP